MLIRTETWTKESHGLYDFEGTDLNEAKFLARGSHMIQRDQSTVRVHSLPIDSASFEAADQQLKHDEANRTIARCLYKDNSYWLFHKALIDESSETVLERKPEEKIWQVVKETS